MLPEVAANRAPLPEHIRWDRLSPASREMLAQVGMRLSAGWLSSEIIEEFNRRPPSFRHVQPPRRGNYTSGWLNSNMRTLRNELVDTADADG